MEENEIKCNNCDKKFSTKFNLAKHIKNSCKVTKKNNIEEIQYKLKLYDDCKLELDNNKNKYNDLMKEYEEFKKITAEKDVIFSKNEILTASLQTENKMLKEQIQFLKEQLEKYEFKNENQLKNILNITETQSKGILDIAKQPKNITTNIKNKLSAPFNLKSQKFVDFIQNKLRMSIDRGDMMDGQKSLARQVYNIVIKDREGKIKYLCVDSSRGIFRYMDEEGNVYTDHKAKLFTDIVLGGIKDNIVNIIEDIEENEEDQSIIQYIKKNLCHIKNMNSDNTDFRNELIVLTSK